MALKPLWPACDTGPAVRWIPADALIKDTDTDTDTIPADALYNASAGIVSVSVSVSLISASAGIHLTAGPVSHAGHSGFKAK